jgi:hypothetical protein
MSAYTVDHFISKFSAIPDDKWADNGSTVNPDGSKCALGHCGANMLHEHESDYTPEALALIELFYAHYPPRSQDERRHWAVVGINDGTRFFDAATPKHRVLNALQNIKRKQKGTPC